MCVSVCPCVGDCEWTSLLCVWGGNTKERMWVCPCISVAIHRAARQRIAENSVSFISGFVAGEILYVCVCIHECKPVGVLCKYACIYLCIPLFAFCC